MRLFEAAEDLIAVITDLRYLSKCVRRAM